MRAFVGVYLINWYLYIDMNEIKFSASLFFFASLTWTSSNSSQYHKSMNGRTPWGRCGVAAALYVMSVITLFHFEGNISIEMARRGWCDYVALWITRSYLLGYLGVAVCQPTDVQIENCGACRTYGNCFEQTPLVACIVGVLQFVRKTHCRLVLGSTL